MPVTDISFNSDKITQCPFLDVFGARNEEMMDIMYMRRMYPKEMNRIQRVVDEVCDSMEYDGSMMYDEYPDRVMMSGLCRRVCDKAQTDNNNSDIHDIVCVMLCNEMCRRRNKRRYERGKVMQWQGEKWSL